MYPKKAVLALLYQGHSKKPSTKRATPGQGKLPGPPGVMKSGEQGWCTGTFTQRLTAAGTGHNSSFLALWQKGSQRLGQQHPARHTKRGRLHAGSAGSVPRAAASLGSLKRTPWQQSPGTAASSARTREAGTWLQLEAVIFSIPPTPPFFWSRYNYAVSSANAPAEFSESKQHIPRDPKCLRDSTGHERRGGSKSDP